MTQVLDHGYVELEQHVGGDHSVVASARRSRHVRWKDAWRGDGSDEKLIARLMRYRHGTPFEHNLFTFSVAAPIFVFREWQRHRIGSYNELSGRYARLEPLYYQPEVGRTTDPDNKQSSIEAPELTEMVYFGNLCDQLFNAYERMLDAGVAREVARMILPLNIYSEMVWSVNARSMMNFLSLRLDSGAQWEIQQFAKQIEAHFAEQMPITHRTWLENDRIAP